MTQTHPELGAERFALSLCRSKLSLQPAGGPLQLGLLPLQAVLGCPLRSCRSLKGRQLLLGICSLHYSHKPACASC